MWLLTAIGPVHGQTSFTFALEQNKTYSVGRDKGCDLRFDSRYVKPVQGHIAVGDWDPFNPTKPPQLEWRSEPNKKGVLPTLRSITIASDDLYGSISKEDYDTAELPEGTASLALHEDRGKGVELYEDCWFTARWSPYSICYERLDKDELSETADVLRRYCIHHTTTVEEEALPNIVISPEFKSTPTLNYAVCYAIRILTPGYLHAILIRLNACWKQAADHQDSFALPNVESKEYEPSLNPDLPHVRKDIEAWSPDKRNRNLFKGWKVLGLKGKSPPAERRYLVAMGATYTDIDVLTKPLVDGKDFTERMAPWLQEFEEQGIDRKNGLVVYFARVSAEINKRMNFVTVVGTPCQRAGVPLASGIILWGAVRAKGVQAYLDFMGEQQQEQVGTNTAMTAANGTARTAAALVPATVPPTQASALQSSAVAAPSSAPPVAETPEVAIPSSFPDETERAALRRQTVKTLSSAQKRSSPEPVEPSSTGVRRPLRRRAARKIDLFADDLDPIPESGDVMMGSRRGVESAPASQSFRAADTEAPQEVVPETQMSSLGPRSRLKRRAGAPESQVKSSYNFGFDDQYETDRQRERADAEYAALYASTTSASRQPASASAYSREPASKRRRLSTPAESLGSNTPEAAERAEGADMDVDEPAEEVEDPMEDLKRRTRQAREQASATPRPVKKSTAAMPPPPIPRPQGQGRSTRSPSEEEEQVEKKKQPADPRKMDRDVEFLQAQQKQRKIKTAEDALDREFTKDFNRLKLTKAKEAEKAPWDRDHPDYNLVDDFGDDLRGNFIEIVRKDLYRKDLGMAAPARVDDGRPNFKKFKKKNIVRREPMRLALVGQHLNDAEMGEPYWVAESARPTKSQGTTQGRLLDDDDDMPVLPRAKKRLIGDNDSPPPEDDLDPPSSSRRRVGRTQITQPIQSTQSTSTRRAPTRTTRASSVATDASDISEAPSGHTRSHDARSKPAAKGRKRMESIVVEDSEEEVAQDLGKLSSGSTRERGTAVTGAKPSRGTRGTTSTLDEDGRAPGGRRVTQQASGVPGTSAMDPPSSSVASTGRAAGSRRKLLVDDDDEDEAIPVRRGLQKKRRLG